jgi:peptide/nickel transport system substrate-binding protein
LGKKKLLWLLSLVLVLSLFLAACTSDKDAADEKDGDTNKEEPKEKEDDDETAGGDDSGMEIAFPTKVSADGEAIEGGSINYGLISDTPFEGTLNYVFYSGRPDAEVLQFFDERLLSTNTDYEITNDGAATFEMSEDNTAITLTIKDNVNWHDGEPVKGDDLLYAYELLGHPDYTGARYSGLIPSVVGMEEYHAGTVDTISGIEVKDDKTVTITFTSANPSLTTGFWAYPAPRHYLGDMTIEEIVESDKIRTTPIGFGPFKVKRVVSGESVEFERYEDYWQGAPTLDSIVLKVVSPSVAVKAMETGDIDISTLPADQYLTAKELTNVELLGMIDLAYTYIGFNLGTWDADKGEAIMDNPKLENKLLRQAMAVALNNEPVGEKMYHGLRFPATTLIPPSFPGYHDFDATAIEYNPERAKELLAEAGYEDTNGDGFVEDPEGNEFKLSFANMSGADVAEPLALHYIQNWEDVGIKVELLEGRLHEFNSFYDRVEANDPKIDIYQAAWGTGTSVDPTGLYGSKAMFNYTRWTNEKNDELLAKGVSEEAFDTEYRQDVYKEWQTLMNEELPVIPTLFRYTLSGVNERVLNYDIQVGSDLYLRWDEVAVSK